MNILIVNAFGKAKKSDDQFREFSNIVKSCFSKAFEESGVIDNINYHIRDISTIDDFLFEKSSVFNNLESLKNFERLDFVFGDGSEKLLPWEPNGQKLSILVKMCMKHEKAMFFCSLGLQIMVFLIATHFLMNFNIINSKVEISSIENIQMIGESFLTGLRGHDFFLDFVTGDLYSYRHETREWAPKLNIGLHNKFIAENIKKRGQFVLVKNQYRPQTSVPGKFSVLGTEKRCFVGKNFKTHWIFEGLGNELLCENSSEWFVHYFSIQDKSLIFNVLLSNDSGPSLIEYKSCYGTNFRAKKETRDCVFLIFNFIKKELNDIYKGTKIQIKFSTKESNGNGEEMFAQPHRSNISLGTNKSLVKPFSANKDNQITSDENAYNNALNKRPIASAKYNQSLSVSRPVSNKEEFLKQLSLSKEGGGYPPESALSYRLLSGVSKAARPGTANDIHVKETTRNLLDTFSDQGSKIPTTISDINEYMNKIKEYTSLVESNKELEEKEAGKTPFQIITEEYRKIIKDHNYGSIESNDSPGRKQSRSPKQKDKKLSSTQGSTSEQASGAKDSSVVEKDQEFQIDPQKLKMMIKQYEKFNQQFYHQDHLNKLFFEGDDNKHSGNRICDQKIIDYYTKKLKTKADEIYNAEEERKRKMETQYNKLTKHAKHEANSKCNRPCSTKLESTVEEICQQKDDEGDDMKANELGAFNIIYPYLSKDEIPKGKKIMFVGQTKEEKKAMNYLIQQKEKDKYNKNPFTSEYANYSNPNNHMIVLNQFQSLQSILTHLPKDQKQKKQTKTPSKEKTGKNAHRSNRENSALKNRPQSSRDLEKLKWMDTNGFKNVFAKENVDIIRVPFVEEQYQGPGAQSFRQVNKDKWICKEKFKI